jgi:hypothetical protein
METSVSLKSDPILIVLSLGMGSDFNQTDGDVTITGKRLQNFGLCSAVRAFEQGGIFIVPHLL